MIVISHIKLIPLFHIIKVTSRETFHIRIGFSKVKAKLIDNPLTPSCLCLLLYKCLKSLP